jgi:hypothetical protein
MIGGQSGLAYPHLELIRLHPLLYLDPQHLMDLHFGRRKLLQLGDLLGRYRPLPREGTLFPGRGDGRLRLQAWRWKG